MNQIISKTIAKIVTSGHLILLAFLPISSFLIQILTNRFGFSELITLWKEAVVALVMLGYLWLLIPKIKLVWAKHKWLIFSTIAALGLVGFSSQNVDIKTLVLGFRVEIYWLLFLVLSVIYGTISDYKFNFKNYFRAILLGFGLVAIPTILSIVLGQDKFLSLVGFNSGWSSSGQFGLQSPNCHTIDTVNGGCRLNGGFSTPNSFAGYLLVILPLFALRLTNLVKFSTNYLSMVFIAVCCSVSTIFLFLTYSRFGWLVFGLYALLAIVHYGKRLKSAFWSSFFKKSFYIVISLPLIFTGLMFVIGANVDDIARAEIFPHSIVRSHSTAGHYKLTKIALQIIERQKPIFLGYGLGQSGPIAKPEYNKDIEKTPIIDQNFDFSDKLLVARYNMAIPENWYLQLILNGGVLYAILYCVILWQLIIGLKDGESWQFAIAAAGFGILSGNLYLHIFESPVVVFYLSILLFVSRNYDNKTHISLPNNPKLS